VWIAGMGGTANYYSTFTAFASSGGNQAHNNMQPYLVLTVCLKEADDAYSTQIDTTN
jgi:microcystin-dependent protein